MRRSIAYRVLILLAALAGVAAHAARIKDICEIQGARGNALKGIGLVVGLAGTGDKAEAAIRAQERVLTRMTVEVGSAAELTSDNVAVVYVTATIPPFAKEGTRIDVSVHSAYDAESLQGGTLMETLLYGADDRVYAVAQGPVSIGGFEADGGGGNTIRTNHVTSGRIPMGAYVEHEVPSTITDGQRIILLLKTPDFSAASNIVHAVNKKYGESASAFGAGSVSVTIPQNDRANLVGFIAGLEGLEVELGDGPARVVINERTGTIVVGGNVRIRPCQVAHGSLTITIAQTPLVSQPAPFSQGQTVVAEATDIGAEEAAARLMPLEGTSAAQVAEGLNRLMVSPRDIIAIFQALREAGVMDADLEIM